LMMKNFEIQLFLALVSFLLNLPFHPLFYLP
jgi:hypothetical protein